jgi:hypothetical protein
MALDIEEAKKKMEEWLVSDAAKAFVENLHKERKVKKGRYRRFEEYLKTHDFNELMNRLILENGDDWCEKCYKKGYEPYPNNKLGFVVDYVMENTKEVYVKELENDFCNVIHEFKEYYFQTVWGQGCYHNVYNKKDKKLILQV